MKFACPKKRQHGFTLVELLVSVSILLLLIGLALVNYFNFHNRQKLILAQELVRESMANVQNSARSGKMRGCSALLHYEISFLGNVITMTPICKDGSEGEFSLIELPDDTLVATTLSLYIKPVSGLIYSDPSLVTPARANLTIKLINESQETSMRIDHSGLVKKLD